MASRINWNHHIEAWQASGLSQAAYCRLHGLGLSSFSARLSAHRAAATAGPARFGAGEDRTRPAGGGRPLGLAHGLGPPAGAARLGGAALGGGAAAVPGLIAPGRILAAAAPVDMRLGADGLSLKLQDVGADPFDGSWFRGRTGSAWRRSCRTGRGFETARLNPQNPCKTRLEAGFHGIIQPWIPSPDRSFLTPFPPLRARRSRPRGTSKNSSPGWNPPAPPSPAKNKKSTPSPAPRKPPRPPS